jgi:predicted dithiol-disulfide oxidoreductase (DUF899 family)
VTTTAGNASRNLPGKPPVVDLATWQAAREELLVREKAHTREGDAIAAARRRGVEAPVGGEMGHIVCFLRDGDRVFLTYSTTGRGNEPVNGSLGLLDMTPYGRREAWEDNPEGWPEAPQADSPVGGHGSPICWYWRSDADDDATWGPTSRPVPQWTRPGATPVETLGRQGHHH